MLKNLSHYLNLIAKNTNVLHFTIMVLWLFILLPIGEWTTNEESYLGFAGRWFNPHQFSSFQDFATYRFLYDGWMGISINYLGGYVVTHAWGRLTVILLFAAALTYFFRTFNFSILESSLIFLGFVALGQGILGAETVFTGLEAKSFAYIFLLFSIADFYRKRRFRGYLFLAITTYFQFLIGGFWFMVLTLFMRANSSPKRWFWKEICLYLVFCLPLFILIIFSQQPSTFDPYQTTVSADWIYTVFRHPHHVAPFSSPETFRLWHRGIITLAGFTFISLLLIYYSNRQEKPYAKLFFFLYLYLWGALLFSYLDRDSLLGKFYLFRPSSFTLFLFLCFLTFYLSHRIQRHRKVIQLSLLTLILSWVFPFFPTQKLIYNRVEAVMLKQQPPSFLRYIPKDLFYNHEDIHVYYHFGGKFQKIVRESDPDDIFLIDPNLEGEVNYLSFERRFNRPTLVTQKFVPTSPDHLQRWYQLVHLKKALFEGGCPATILKNYPVRYLVTHIENNEVDNCGQIVYRRGVKLIEVAPIFQKNS